MLAVRALGTIPMVCIVQIMHASNTCLTIKTMQPDDTLWYPPWCALFTRIIVGAAHTAQWGCLWS